MLCGVLVYGSLMEWMHTLSPIDKLRHVEIPLAAPHVFLLSLSTQNQQLLFLL